MMPVVVIAAPLNNATETRLISLVVLTLVVVACPVPTLALLNEAGPVLRVVVLLAGLMIVR